MDTPPALRPQSRDRRHQKPRTPLQERSQSQTNEDSSRLRRDVKRERSEFDVFSTTPFPTKPQHILLPSTLRKQQSFHDGENLTANYFGRSLQGNSSQQSIAQQEDSTSEESRGRRAPVLQLKRSVSTLRDMYEAQAERSRPSTAASSALRPGTAGSRLRSASSSEGLARRDAWAELHKISADDLATLPTLSRSSVEQLASSSSFASRVGKTQLVSSSPNFQTFGSSSSKFPVFQDDAVLSSDGHHQSSSSGAVQTSSSSPNFVRLGRSSSIVETLNTEQSSSSPIFVKLGTSSPGLRMSSSPTPSVASAGSKKRKRSEKEAETSFAARSRAFGSSPPYVAGAASSSEPSLRSPDSIMPSSPPRPESIQSQSIAASSPVYRMPIPVRKISGSSSSTSTHASLQEALTSSPMPPIQYPVIRAPIAAASTLNIPKRVIRNTSTESGPQYASRLSPVPSEWDEHISRPESKTSQLTYDSRDDPERSDSIAPPPTGNESQIRIIAVSEDDHHLEAADELRALPGRGLAYRSPPLVPVRTNSLFGTTSNSSGSHSQSRLDSLRTSVDTRLNSLRSFAHSRQNSFMSGSIRPSSSGSQTANPVVPAWARRYYSGLYRDSFQYLYPSQSNSAAQLQVSVHPNITERTTSLPPRIIERIPSTDASRRHSGRSWQSIKDSLRTSVVGYVPSALLPKSKPQVGARKSHLTVGTGPLVSNPVTPNIAHTRFDAHDENPTIRRVSDQLPPSDPRAHWAGVTDEQQVGSQYQGSTPYHSSNEINRHSADGESIYFDAASGQYFRRSRLTDIPHLHHDRRLNTGSSKSRGFGFPFNQKSRFRAPSVYDDSTRPSWFHLDLRDAQVTCFIAGFVCPFTWFVGAFLPLPTRPESFEDIEKAMYDAHPDNAAEWRDLDIVARLRLERHIKGVEELKWQNARWWKRMNRWMCFVGLVVFVLAIVLAVIGTRNNW